MGKISFKLRIFKLFQFCRPSTLPTDPVPASRRPPPSSKCHVSSSPTSPPSSNHTGSPPETFHWRNEEEWHTVARGAHDAHELSQRFSFSNIGSTPDETPRHKIYNSSASDNDLFSATVTSNRRKKRNKSAVNYRHHRNSNSSAESSEEKESLMCSSRSFSTDSEMNGQMLETILERGKCRKKQMRKDRGKGKMVWHSSELLVAEEEEESPARLSLFKRLVPCVMEGKVKESFAVVKKSEDPYEDFKRSMMEMILEKKLFEHKELEDLLQCFLSLNSSLYHGLIVEAFSEIWEAMFC